MLCYVVLINLNVWWCQAQFYLVECFCPLVIKLFNIPIRRVMWKIFESSPKVLYVRPFVCWYGHRPKRQIKGQKLLSVSLCVSVLGFTLEAKLVSSKNLTQVQLKISSRTLQNLASHLLTKYITWSIFAKRLVMQITNPIVWQQNCEEIHIVALMCCLNYIAGGSAWSSAVERRGFEL